MNRKLLFIPLVLFLALAAALFWQLMRNADGMTRRPSSRR